jgi:hypothetical protein
VLGEAADVQQRRHQKPCLRRRGRGSPPARAGNGGQQTLVYGSTGARRNLAHRHLLNDAALVHDATRSAISAMTPKSCVMSSSARLKRAVSSRSRSRICAWMVTSSAVGRLVGDYQRRRARQRDGDHHALPHAARQLMRILPRAPGRLRNVDRVQQFDGLLARASRVRAVDVQRLGDLFARRASPGSGRHRLLEDQRDAGAAHGLHLALVQCSRSRPSKRISPRRDRRGWRQQPQDRRTP